MRSKKTLPCGCFLLLLLLLVAAGSAPCDAQPSPSTSDAPWLHEACENPLLGRNGRFPPLSTYYYVQLYSTPSSVPGPGASQSSPQYEAIVSLCNTTLKTPRFTKPCVLNKFFLGVWSSGGDCIGAYDQVVSTSEVADFNGTGGSSYTVHLGSSVNVSQSFTYTLRCQLGSIVGGAETSSFSPTSMLQVTADLCPTSALGPETNNRDDDVKGKVVLGVLIPIAAGICVALGIGIGVLYMRRRRLPVPSEDEEEEADLA